MKPTAFINFEAKKIVGRRSTYVARLGNAGPEGQGSTKTIALADLFIRAETQERNLYTQSIRWSTDGSVWLLRYVHGWQYERFAPGAQYSSGCTMLTVAGHKEALASMEAALRQYDEVTS